MAILRSFTLFLEEKSSESWKGKWGQDILFLWCERYNWYFGYDPVYEEYLIIKERRKKSLEQHPRERKRDGSSEQWKDYFLGVQSDNRSLNVQTQTPENRCKRAGGEWTFSLCCFFYLVKQEEWS